MLFLQFTTCMDPSSKCLPADVVFLVFQFLGEGFISKTLFVKRNDTRQGSENENRLDLAAYLIRKGRLLPPLSDTCRILSEISIECRSKDQGWSSYPSETGKRTSNTWADVRVNIVRNPQNNSDSIPSFLVYRNKHAGKTWEDHKAVFTSDSALVFTLEKALEEIREQVRNGSSCRSSRSRSRSGSANSDSDLFAVTTSLDGKNQAAAPISELSVQLWAHSQYPGWKNLIEYSSIRFVFSFKSYAHWQASDPRASRARNPLLQLCK